MNFRITRRRAVVSDDGFWSPLPQRCKNRTGQTNPVLLILLAGILLALIVLIVVVLIGRGTDNGRGDTGTPKGGIFRRIDLESPPEPHKPFNNPERIKETLQQGKTYRVVLKAGFTARVEDKDYSVKTVTHLDYLAEFVINRLIESNDGHRVVERRHFEEARNVKLLADVEGAEIELGVPGQLLLAGLDWVAPGAGRGVLALKPVAAAETRLIFPRRPACASGLYFSPSA